MQDLRRRSKYTLYVLCFLALCANVAFWSYSRKAEAKWANVPPVPSVVGASFFGLGDTQLAYRYFGIVLQNLGDTGGLVTPLNDYNYARLGDWFNLSYKLDPASDFVPLLAAYYFGGTNKPEDLTPVIDYLAEVGNTRKGEKWRWLAHAVYLARFKQHDSEKALKLAYKLSALYHPGMPLWARQMPVFVMTEKGSKDAALQLMINILAEEGDKIHPNEVNFMRYFICDRILDPDEARENSLCQSAY